MKWTLLNTSKFHIYIFHLGIYLVDKLNLFYTLDLYPSSHNLKCKAFDIILQLESSTEWLVGTMVGRRVLQSGWYHGGEEERPNPE